MRDCSYSEEKNMFDFTYPELKSPYILDLCHQYSIAILSELTSLADEDLGIYIHIYIHIHIYVYIYVYTYEYIS
jgi:hypothetical protein